LSELAKKTIIETDMAWDTDVRPDKITFEYDIDKDISKCILSAVCDQFFPDKIHSEFSLKALKSVVDPAGHYCLTDENNKYFLRISRRQRKNPVIEDDIIEYLSNVGIKVNSPLSAGKQIAWNNHTYLLCVFPLLNVRHFDGSKEDLSKLASAVFNLHEKLKEYHFKEKVCAHAFETAERLAMVQEQIKGYLVSNKYEPFNELADWVISNRNWIDVMLREFDPYMCKRNEAQLIHGELHLGNVMFALEDGDVIFTDFEESPDAWLPCSFDLAYIAHRFCMDRNPSEQLFVKRIEVIRDHYGQLPDDLKQMMRNVCWYNVTLTIDRSLRRESFTTDIECDKFVNFERLTNKYM
jgi:Ser/Thr protein kinase RdoA (MazF antagonist)